MMLGCTRKVTHKATVLQLLVVFFVVLLVCVNNCVVGLGLSSTNVGMKCIERERHALLMIKKDLVDEFDHLSSWSNEEGQKDCCNWRGIRCNNLTGHVTMLDLQVSASYRWWAYYTGAHYEPLRGKISPSLLELQHLTYLDLSNNDFGGSHIPHFIGSLAKLRYLYLSYAEFGGTIPYHLGNLSSLQVLDLNSFRVDSSLNSETLGWLSCLSSLTYLDMTCVNLEKAVDWIQTISMLPSIEELYLFNCSLSSTIHPHLSLFNSSTSLYALDLSYNNLNSIIYRWLFNFAGSSLVNLELSENQLEGPIPDALRNMTSLAHLSLSNNQIEGGIPKFLGNMLSIRTLDLVDNKINGNLDEIVRNLSGHAMNTLEILYLAYNGISGSVPDITIFSSLKELYLYNNNLDGSLPSRFELPSKLEVLELSENQITGSLPDLSVFSSLRELLLSNNRISGSLPESIGQLSKLEDLSIASNQLQGTISKAHFSNLTNLKNLDLSNNNLTLQLSSEWLPPFQLDELALGSCKLGPRFPVWLRYLKNLSRLDISNNQISDIVPNWFWGLHYNLWDFNLSHNHITGILPTNLSSTFPHIQIIDLSLNHLEGPLPIFPSNTTTLLLSNNMFTGPISVICAIIGGALKQLDLSNNFLSGQLPDCWWQWEELIVLNLANNSFDGKIPSSIGSLRWIESLHLQKNNLIGELPSSLQNCTSLITMDVGENKLSGKLPTWIGEKLSRLVIFILRSNEFYGIIPAQLCYLEYVQFFDISLNSITGTIPRCFNNFTAIAQNWTFSKTIGRNYLTEIMREGNLNFHMDQNYVDNALVAWKGRIFKYGNTLGLVKSIDLSSNNLMGEIPLGITNLSGLISLNLSRNNLVGSIPLKIGQLRSLESLDLSRNRFFGEIPRSMSDLNCLSYLDLSYNNLSGKIPSGTQLQTLEASSFAGNPALYGPPLTQKCPGDYACQGPPTTGGGREDAGTQKHEDKWFYASIALGFIVGFWGVCGTLVLHQSWRHAYFRLFDNSKDCIYAKTAVHTARFKRKLRAGCDRFL